MAKITAAVVKELRAKTGAGMMDCKRALVATGADIEAAVDWLRKQGVAVATKKAGRAASDGLIGVAVTQRKAAIVEINSETDFVARSDAFQETVRAIATVALDSGTDLEALKSEAYPGADGTVADSLFQLVAKVGENIQLRRVAGLTVEQGALAAYVHGALAPGLGRIGVLVALESEGDAGTLAAFGKRVAMHVAAARPRALTRNDVSPAALERERAVLAEQTRASGKPENIVEKMIEGRLRKFYEEVVLLDQVYVIDGKSKLSEAIEEAARDIGAPIRISGFVRFALGEAVGTDESDGAAAADS
ncbi:MAG: elongation factor Ts [Proteobacteria bacterium]|nr:elongation factor Ts [Pseudomonadota bacterium]